MRRNKRKAVFILVVAQGGRNLRTTPRPASRRNGTSIRYLWPSGHFHTADGTSVRYWMGLGDFSGRNGSITNHVPLASGHPSHQQQPIETQSKEGAHQKTGAVRQVRDDLQMDMPLISYNRLGASDQTIFSSCPGQNDSHVRFILDIHSFFMNSHRIENNFQ